MDWQEAARPVAVPAPVAQGMRIAKVNPTGNGSIARIRKRVVSVSWRFVAFRGVPRAFRTIC